MFGYDEITWQYYDRYRLPVMHTETNIAQGAKGNEAVYWLWKQWANVLQLRNSGVPLVGFTWYSLTDQIDWDTALLVAHGGVNRALLSWFLTGAPSFLGGLAQDPGCLNIIDIGPGQAQTVVRVVNFCPLEPLQTGTRASTMEHLLQQYLRCNANVIEDHK